MAAAAARAYFGNNTALGSGMCSVGHSSQWWELLVHIHCIYVVYVPSNSNHINYSAT